MSGGRLFQSRLPVNEHHLCSAWSGFVVLCYVHVRNFIHVKSFVGRAWEVYIQWFKITVNMACWHAVVRNDKSWFGSCTWCRLRMHLERWWDCHNWWKPSWCCCCRTKPYHAYSASGSGSLQFFSVFFCMQHSICIIMRQHCNLLWFIGT